MSNPHDTPDDPICGNCGNPLSKHFPEQCGHKWTIYCNKVTNGDVFTEEPSYEQQLEADIAELVGLLRMGRELSEASRDTLQGTPAKRIRALEHTNRIIALYDAAIDKHGGNA